MARQVVVPDASVLLKWVLKGTDEADTGRALALRASWLEEACDLVVPALWIYEVGNVVGLKQPGRAADLMRALVDLGLEEQSPRTYLATVLDLMRDHGVTFYDAAYHGLAIHVRGTMVTADRAYLRKAGGAGHVVALSDWPD